MTTHAFDEHAPVTAAPAAQPHEPIIPKAEPKQTDPNELLAGLEQRHAGPTHGTLRTKKSKAAQTQPGGDATSPRSIITSLKAAQHALDETPAKAKRPQIKAQALIAGRHLVHAWETLNAAPSARTQETIAASDSVGESYFRFLERVLPLELADDYADEVKTMFGAYEGVRFELGLPVNTKTPVGYKPETGSDASYAKAAVPSSLALVESYANGLLSALENSSPENRNKILADKTPPLHEAAVYTDWLIEQIPNSERGVFKPQANQAANRILDVLTWIRSRPGEKMGDYFQSVVDAMDRILTRQGLPAVERRPPRTLRTEAERNEAETERNAVAAGRKLLETKLTALHLAKERGVKKFEKLVVLEDVEKPDFADELAKAILVASLGHLGGWIANGLGGVAGTKDAAKAAANAAAASKLADITTDSIQGIAGQAVAGGLTGASKVNERVRAETFFVLGRLREIALFSEKYGEVLSKQIADNMLSLETIHRDIAAVEVLSQHAEENYFVESAKAWALYCAQTYLTVDPKRGVDKQKRKVSDMDNYFGAHPDRRDGGGILDVKFEIHDDPRRAGEPRIVEVGTSIREVNSEIADAILDDVDGRMDLIYLPKELSLRLVDRGGDEPEPSTGHTDTVPRGGAPTFARLAVDESNKVRDSSGWGQLKIPGARPRFYDDPEELWKRIQKTILTFGRRLKAAAQSGTKR